ncbi:MAG: hypothetical protein ACLSGB_02115 [Dorea sp.]
MKSISIYAVTRNQNIEQLQKLERQLSGREYFLKMRTWELESMRSLVRELEAHMDEVYALRFLFLPDSETWKGICMSLRSRTSKL